MNRTLDVTSSWAASIVRGFNGYFIGRLGSRPPVPVELYEFEGCPFCRLVRDALSELDLEARIYPCPKGGERFRPEAVRLGGKAMFPFLVDENAGVKLYGSQEIIEHLYRSYGDGPPPLRVRIRQLNLARSVFASAVRSRGGSRAAPSVRPEKPLELWSFEASPYSRLAREALCRLELPYLLHNVAKRSPSRSAFVARSGKMMVPYLADPNTGRAMFESAGIVRYLDETYGARA
jgi:glutathione S-transferase